jgi:uncharacterized membrane protein YuzA (DUF378 family)
MAESNGWSGWSKAALALVIVGAINWGLIGFFNWNLVDAIFGGGAREETSAISRVIYAVVGLAGLASLARLLARTPHARGPERMAPRRPVAS